jgi:hypothetical protein
MPAGLDARFAGALDAGAARRVILSPEAPAYDARPGSSP